MTARRVLQIVGSLFMAVGVVLALYVAYSYFAPDLAFALGERDVAPAAPAADVPPLGVPTIPVGHGQPTGLNLPVLNLPYPRGLGQPAVRIVVPSLKLDAPVQEATWTTTQQNGTLYSDWAIPYHAAGYLVNTAKPGEAGNFVLAGHHNLTGPNRFGVGLFAGLWNLKPGDLIFVYDAAGRLFDYQVVKSYYVRELGEPLPVRQQHAREILSNNGQPLMTLITCWNGQAAPLSGNTYRWIISAKLIGLINPG